MVDRTANLMKLVLLITLPKMVARALKWAVSMRLDASYSLCSKLGSKLMFLIKNYGNFSFARTFPDFDYIFLSVFF
jgi:hypothetical protein